MLAIFSLFLSLAIVTPSVFAVPTDNIESLGLLQTRAGTPSSSGIHSGFYYNWWADGTVGSQATYTNGNAGHYSLRWSRVGNLFGGKGWNPGSRRVISYIGQYNPNGNGFLSVYGWTRSPLVEYYITESFGVHNPAAGAIYKGAATCNGVTYRISQLTRVNQPSIDGPQTFKQFWSVRDPRKTPSGSISGTVDTGCHFDAWENFGMNLGSEHDFQIVATEAYYSSGSSNITVF